MNKKVLVVAAHPDDEILGCGATILKHILDGDFVHILIMAEGITSRQEIRNVENNKDNLLLLHNHSYVVAKKLGAEKFTMLNFPDNRMDSIDLLDIIKPVEKIIENDNIEIIYTHFINDINIDHQITHKAVVTAARALPCRNIKQILFFETPSSTDYQIYSDVHSFTPNWFVDVEDFIDRKIEILKEYDSEMRKYPHSRSYDGIKILAQYRGLAIGRKYAEAFVLGRNIL